MAFWLSACQMQMRGMRVQGAPLRQRLGVYLRVALPIVAGAIRRSEQLSVAMEARAFSYEGKHTALRDLRPTTKGEIVVDVIAVLYLIGAIVYRVLVATGILG